MRIQVGIVFRILCVVLCITASAAHALPSSAPATSDQTIARLLADRDGVSAGDPFWIALHLELKNGWHSYWQNSGDSGIPTKVTLTLPQGFTASEMQFIPPKRVAMSGIINYVHDKDAWHFINVTPPASFEKETLIKTSVPIEAQAEWLVCKDICIPESATLSLTLPVSTIPASVDSGFHRIAATVPKLSDVKARFNVVKDVAYVVIEDVSLDKGMQFFPLDNGVVSNDILPNITHRDDGVLLTFKAGTTPPTQHLRAVVQKDKDGRAYEILAARDETLGVTDDVNAASVTSPTQSDITLIVALALAFGGGLLLNLMPCVLPILSLKALSLMRIAEHSRRESARHGVAYTLGVVGSFIAFAVVLIVVQQGGAQIGWGFQLQSPAFVAGLSLLMLLVGLNLSGVYEVPMLLGNAGQSFTAQPTPFGSFATGILAVFVATPCTAPLMAPAIGFALSQSPVALITVFVALGLGLAAPFLLMSLYPAFSKCLPKAGAWMLRVKQFLAFPMYGTAAWLAWVLARQSGTDALAVLFTVAVIAALLVWSASIARTRIKRIIVVAVLVVTCGAALNVIAMLPPAQSLQPSLSSSHLKPYSQPTLNALIREGKPVFLYATADWCITCKVNERLALNTNEVQEHFHSRKITVLKADWTNRDTEITALLARYGRAGVPMYVYYPPHANPVLLPQILTIATVIEATQSK